MILVETLSGKGKGEERIQANGGGNEFKYDILYEHS
jgi:hypothetical protein